MGARTAEPGARLGRMAAALAAAALALSPLASRADGALKFQQITFAEIADRTVGDAPFALSAKASSGLPVSFLVVDGPAVLDGKNLRLTNTPGLVFVRATQAGDSVFAPAKPEVRAFGVKQKPLAPSFVSQPGAIHAELGSIVVLSSSVLGYPAPGLQWRKDSVPLAGATERTLTLPSVSLSDAGTYDVVATNPSGTVASARALVQVTKRRQSIVFPGPGSAVAGQGVVLSASATSGLPVRLSVISGSASLSGTALVAQPGMVSVQAAQEGDSDYEAAQPVTQTFMVSASPSGQRLP